MARQGVAPGPALDHILETYCAPGSPVRIEGLMTHFSAPEVLAAEMPLKHPLAETPAPAAPTETDRQIERFSAACRQLQSYGIHPQWIHAGNSATLLEAGSVPALSALAQQSGARFMLRPGLALYGYPVRFTQQPAAEASAALRPVLSWKTRITSLRTIAPGETAGYNSTFRAQRPTRLALTPTGYADGLNRQLSNRGTMLVQGHRAPIAGRISMDQTILDVTDIPSAAIGDEVVILGEQGTASTTAYDQADLCNTIPYEILCNISARVRRTPKL